MDNRLLYLSTTLTSTPPLAFTSICNYLKINQLEIKTLLNNSWIQRKKQTTDYLKLAQIYLISKHKNTLLYAFIKNLKLLNLSNEDLWSQTSKPEFKS